MTLAITRLPYFHLLTPREPNGYSDLPDININLAEVATNRSNAKPNSDLYCAIRYLFSTFETLSRADNTIFSSKYNVSLTLKLLLQAAHHGTYDSSEPSQVNVRQ